tara:strand:- start:1540 stop:1728 length:189 start_codon:yes stop_codon:yes gene_type:complete
MNNPKSELIKTLELSVNYSLKRINTLEKNNFYRESSSLYQEFKEWIEGDYVFDRILFTKYIK